MFEFIIVVYCLVGLTYNLFLIPHKNKEIYKQNQYILERYEKMDEALDKLIEYLESQEVE
jgi:hypothetical protein